MSFLSLNAIEFSAKLHKKSLFYLEITTVSYLIYRRQDSLFPLEFLNLSPNKFPPTSSAPMIVPLYVAAKRGLDLSSIDFLLGGSALNTLAQRELPTSCPQ